MRQGTIHNFFRKSQTFEKEDVKSKKTVKTMKAEFEESSHSKDFVKSRTMVQQSKEKFGVDSTNLPVNDAREEVEITDEVTKRSNR